MNLIQNCEYLNLNSNKYIKVVIIIVTQNGFIDFLFVIAQPALRCPLNIMIVDNCHLFVQLQIMLRKLKLKS